MTLYRLHDSDPAIRGVVEISEVDALAWNKKGWGIFRTVNSFHGARRIENLEHINSWAIDIDDGTKKDQFKLIRDSPLQPSRVVETKRGFQVYWDAIDGTKENWNLIVLHRLVPWFGADNNARDIARILRMPGYYHMKDPDDPFLVTCVYFGTASYLEREMMSAFPDQVAIEEQKRDEYLQRTQADRELYGDTIWDRIYDIDCVEGLRRLSGHWSVGGEQFDFMKCRNGNHNILVDGKGTSCWVDKGGHIGSLDKGGPTLIQWLMWYGRSKGESVKILKELFPTLEAE